MKQQNNLAGSDVDETQNTTAMDEGIPRASDGLSTMDEGIPRASDGLSTMVEGSLPPRTSVDVSTKDEGLVKPHASEDLSTQDYNSFIAPGFKGEIFPKESAGSQKDQTQNSTTMPKVRPVVRRLCSLPYVPQHRVPAAKAKVFKDQVTKLPGPSSPFHMIDVVPATATKVALPSVASSLEAVAASIVRKYRMEVLSDEKSPDKLRKLSRGLTFVDHLKLASVSLENQQEEQNQDQVEEVNEDEENQPDEANLDQVEEVNEDEEHQPDEANQDEDEENQPDEANQDQVDEDQEQGEQ